MVVQFVFQPAWQYNQICLQKYKTFFLYEIKKNIEFFECFAFDKLSEWIGTVTLLNKLPTIIRDIRVGLLTSVIFIFTNDALRLRYSKRNSAQMLESCGGGGGFGSELPK